MRARECTLIGLLLGGMLVACGDDGAGGSNTNHSFNQNQNQQGGLSVAEYCTGEAALEQAWCDYGEQCCTVADRASSVYGIFMAHCAYGPANVQSCIDQIVEWQDNGLVVYHGDQAQACLNARATYIAAPPSSCMGLNFFDADSEERYRQVSTQIDACRATFQGQTQQGESCTGTTQCAAGLACHGGGGVYSCQPVRQLYGSCTQHAHCEPGLMCIMDQCATPGQRHASCEYNHHCTSELLCRGGEYCDYPIPAWGVCDPSRVFDCEPGYVCSYTSSTCVLAASSGTSCTFDAECGGRCEAGSCVDICGGGWR